MNSIFRTGAILAATAVILGAFGAHALRDVLSGQGLALWETAVRYHFYHALAVLIVGVMYDRSPVGRLRWSCLLFLAGFILFCGSLYALAFREMVSVSLSWLGPVTPLGGLCFILAWLVLAFSTEKRG